MSSSVELLASVHRGRRAAAHKPTQLAVTATNAALGLAPTKSTVTASVSHPTLLRSAVIPLIVGSGTLTRQ
jgi:hypothetical protein